MHTLSPVLRAVVGLSCGRREPFRDAATVNYEDRDPPTLAKRGRAKGQMPDFGVAAAVGYATADCVRVKTGLVRF